MALPTSRAARYAPPRLRSRTTRIGRSGCGVRSSMITKVISRAAAPTSMATVSGAPQPSVAATVNP